MRAGHDIMRVHAGASAAVFDLMIRTDRSCPDVAKGRRERNRSRVPDLATPETVPDPVSLRADLPGATRHDHAGGTKRAVPRGTDDTQTDTEEAEEQLAQTVDLARHAFLVTHSSEDT